VKALDTGVLLALLEGSPKVREQVRRLRGAEVATTEANLLELACLAAAAPPKSRKARLDAIERLRARLTVLPIDARATREAARRGAGAGRGLPPTVLAMLGALAAAGCEELLTDTPRSISGDWGLRVRNSAV
jgi:predicted nucleic acid-binding protein